MHPTQEAWAKARALADETESNVSEARSWLSLYPHHRDKIEISNGRGGSITTHVPRDVVKAFESVKKHGITKKSSFKKMEVPVKSEKNPSNDPGTILFEVAEIARKYGGLNHITHAVKVLRQFNS